jgi:hypothetical protein
MASTPFLKLEVVIDSSPSYFKYKCTSDNKTLTRGIKTLSLSQVSELKAKLEDEYADFEKLYEEHTSIDNQCKQIINEQLVIFQQDKKQKELYNKLKLRYQTALDAKSTTFLGVYDYGLKVKSVAGTNLINFIIKFHRHKCQYTNMFKEFCGDTKKEINRLTMILDSDRLNAAYSSSVSDDEFEKPQPVKEEDKKILDMREAISKIELDVDEEW